MDVRKTWGCSREFSGRRVAVALSPAWEAIYVLDLNTDTAEFAGHLLPEVPPMPPCYDREVGHIVDADGAEAVFVSSGRMSGRHYLIVKEGT